jgi:hypothetical protein
MLIADVARIASALTGVRARTERGLTAWRYHGRLVARELDAGHVVLRTDFPARDVLLRSFPNTFIVPPRFAAHMMVVADLQNGDAAAIEDAIVAAWDLQANAS